jgi:putative transposase
MAPSNSGARRKPGASAVDAIAWRGCASWRGSRHGGSDGSASSSSIINCRRRRRTSCSKCFVVPRLNRVWVGDLTHVPTRAGWLYVAVLLDVCSRRVIGWAMSARPDQQLALDALAMAVRQRRVRAGLIHHSDQGAQYSALLYQRRLAEMGITPSMSRKGNCYDNAVAESFFSTLKNELTHYQTYHSRDEASRAIFAFIEGFYNRQRLHQSLGYLTPLAFERRISDS